MSREVCAWRLCVAAVRGGCALALRCWAPVLADALMLAECDECIHADSNVTVAAAIMNPTLVMRHVLG